MNNKIKPGHCGDCCKGLIIIPPIPSGEYKRDTENTKYPKTGIKDIPIQKRAKNNNSRNIYANISGGW